jgi:hypothetical protein
MSVIEGQDLGNAVAPGASVLEMEKLEPLEDSQAEIYEKAFKVFQDARQNLEALLVAGGFSNKDIVKAVFQGDNKHFVTRPSKNGDSV